MKIALVVLVVAVGVLGLVELVLRWFGFGSPLLYLPDPQIGYLIAPNQQVRRFRNQIAINAYSMRSPAIAATRPEGTLRVLLLGDSVANGGWWTDQANTISALMERQLASKSPPGRAIEVLNASANSWGPRNELAYLERFGTFESQVLVLLLNTDDLFATAPTSLVVGQDRNYPDRTPPLGLVEFLGRLLPARPPSAELQAIQSEKGDRVKVNLDAVRQIHTLVQRAGGQLILGLTPLKRELGEPGPRDYEKKARQRLTDFTQAEGIPYLDFLPIFEAHPQPELLYQDHIHLNPSGNQLVSQQLCEQIPVEL